MYKYQGRERAQLYSKAYAHAIFGTEGPSIYVRVLAHTHSLGGAPPLLSLLGLRPPRQNYSPRYVEAFSARFAARQKLLLPCLTPTPLGG